MAGNIARNLQTTSSVMATFVAMFTEQFNVFYFTINIVQRYNVAITFVFYLGYDIFWAILSSETSSIDTSNFIVNYSNAYLIVYTLRIVLKYFIFKSSQQRT